MARAIYGARMARDSVLKSSEIPPAARDRRRIGIWLLSVALLVFAMVVLGGYTRLTSSGLSMVDWRPATGWLPPIGEAAWAAAFADYRQYPEYQKVNLGMSLAEFQRIYLVEYAHRLLGRAIGLAFLVPLIYFLIAAKITRRLAGWLVVLFVLGGLQGVLGWFMVRSGLVDRPDVSHYRLVAHLGAALLIYGLLLWTAFELLVGRRAGAGAPPGGSPGAPAVRRLAVVVLVGVVVQILAGGLVAGLDAGLVYNSFPLMGGGLVPDDLMAMAPGWLNVFENPAMVQFDHRLIAYLLVVGAAVLYWQAGRAALTAEARLALQVLVATLGVQIGLGILALVYLVPVALGVLHQAGALVVFTANLYLVHRLSGRAG